MPIVAVTEVASDTGGGGRNCKGISGIIFPVDRIIIFDLPLLVHIIGIVIGLSRKQKLWYLLLGCQ